MAKFGIRLLVAQATKQDSIQRMLDRLEVLHPNKNRTDIEVIVWDGKKPLAEFIRPQTQLYADPKIADLQVGSQAIADWSRNWSQVSARKSAFVGEKRGKPLIPLFIYLGKKISG